MIRHYLSQVLRVLEAAHRAGIMHRDVKKGNILVNEQTGQLWLIDWGLAEFYHPGREYPVRVATRAYKGPELLLNLRDYDYSLDMWSLGCVFGAMLFRKSQLFKGEDDWGQLRKIIKILGTDDLDAYVSRYEVVNKDYERVRRKMGARVARVPWEVFAEAAGVPSIPPAAVDLLNQMLRYDHAERITATDALAHPFLTGEGADTSTWQVPVLEEEHSQAHVMRHGYGYGYGAEDSDDDRAPLPLATAMGIPREREATATVAAVVAERPGPGPRERSGASTTPRPTAAQLQGPEGVEAGPEGGGSGEGSGPRERSGKRRRKSS